MRVRAGSSGGVGGEDVAAKDVLPERRNGAGGRVRAGAEARQPVLEAVRWLRGAAVAGLRGEEAAARLRRGGECSQDHSRAEVVHVSHTRPHRFDGIGSGGGGGDRHGELAHFGRVVDDD